MRLATAYVCDRASADLFTELIDCVANGASCVAVCLVRASAIAMRVGRCYAPAKHLLCAVYCVADGVTALVRALAVDMCCGCVFRQEDICTVLVSKILFLHELGPHELVVSGLKCTWTLLMYLWGDYVYLGLRVEV